MTRARERTLVCRSIIHVVCMNVYTYIYWIPVTLYCDVYYFSMQAKLSIRALRHLIACCNTLLTLAYIYYYHHATGSRKLHTYSMLTCLWTMHGGIASTHIHYQAFLLFWQNVLKHWVFPSLLTAVIFQVSIISRPCSSADEVPAQRATAAAMSILALAIVGVS